MRYGAPYADTLIPDSLIESSLDLVSDLYSGEIVKNGENKSSSKRDSLICGIHDRDLMANFMNIALAVNKHCAWDFKIDALEPLQYGEYHEGQMYDWHTDQHNVPDQNGRVRKFSFSVFLNNDYDGGEFDLELSGPSSECRYKTFKDLEKNTAVFFHSHSWHRVRPVKSGVRKSLVGWVLGPKYQ